MPDHSSDAERVLEPQAEASPEAVAGSARDAAPLRVRVRIPRRDWRLGGRTVLAWREWLLAVALISLGVGVLLAAFLGTSATPLGRLAATIALWVAMLVPIVWAFRRSRPAGLLRFRALDLLWGVAFALVLRLVQGWLDVAFGASGALPAYPLVDGALAPEWWFTGAIGAVVISPMVEEFFFRAVLVVALFTVLRGRAGRLAAGLIAVVVSSGLFVVVHALDADLDTSQLAAIGLLGLVCALLVTLTGRIWGAVLVHVLYAASYVALALAGTFLA